MANRSDASGYVELVRDNRGFRLLWLGQLVSLLGDWFSFVATATLVGQLTGSNLAVGGLFVVRMLPPFLVSPLSGVVADRFDRRNVLILTDLARAVVVLGFLLVRTPGQAWLLYALSALQLALSGFFFPARNALLPDLVSTRELGTANALSSATWSVMLALGAALGGLVAGRWGTGPAFVVDAATSPILVERGESPPRASRFWTGGESTLEPIATGSPQVERELLRLVLDHVAAGVYLVGPDGGIALWSRGAERITGYTADEVLGRPCSAGILVHLDEEGTRLCNSRSCPVCVAQNHGHAGPTRVLLQHRDGHRLPARTRATAIRDGSGTPLGVVVIITDDSARLAAEEEVERLSAAALLDPLTGIGNRRFGERGLATMLDEMRRYGWLFGAILIDLDDFKRVNDSHGHPVGDQVLVTVARTLAGSVRSFDVVSRWGGDEFLLLLANLSEEELRARSETLCSYVAQSTVTAPGGPVTVTASVGAALARLEDTSESLVGRADRQMYRAKHGGRNRAFLEKLAPIPEPS